MRHRYFVYENEIKRIGKVSKQNVIYPEHTNRNATYSVEPNRTNAHYHINNNPCKPSYYIPWRQN